MTTQAQREVSGAILASLARNLTTETLATRLARFAEDNRFDTPGMRAAYLREAAHRLNGERTAGRVELAAEVRDLLNDGTLSLDDAAGRVIDLVLGVLT